MSEEKRRKWSPERRAAILREPLVDKKHVSDIGEVHNIEASLFCSWLRQLFDNMEVRGCCSARRVQRRHGAGDG